MHHPIGRDTGWNEKQLSGSSLRDRSDDRSHNEQTFYHRPTSRSRNNSNTLSWEHTFNSIDSVKSQHRLPLTGNGH